MGLFLQHLVRYHAVNNFLYRVVKGGESWCHCFNQKTNDKANRGNIWTLHCQRSPNWCRMLVSCWHVFLSGRTASPWVPGPWPNDQHWTLLQYLAPFVCSNQGQVVWLVVLWSGFAVWHNVQPQMAAVTQNCLTKFLWTVLEQPPYSLDLLPSDFHILFHMLFWLDSEVMNNVRK